MFRRLAADNPTTFEPALAASLNNLSNRMAHQGRSREAQAAIDEAVALHSRLAAATAATDQPPLNAPNNVSMQMAEMADEVRTSKEEAVALCLRLAAAEPPAYQPALATALNNLGVQLAGTGHADEGRACIEEAFRLYCPLAAANPSTYQSALAAVVDNRTLLTGSRGFQECCPPTNPCESDGR